MRVGASFFVSYRFTLYFPQHYWSAMGYLCLKRKHLGGDLSMLFTDDRGGIGVDGCDDVEAMQIKKSPIPLGFTSQKRKNSGNKKRIS